MEAAAVDEVEVAVVGEVVGADEEVVNSAGGILLGELNVFDKKLQRLVAYPNLIAHSQS